MAQHEQQAGAAAPAGDWTWRSESYAWWVVVVLAVGMALSVIDRLILAMLVEPIKADLAINDTQISLLHGLAFTLLYVVMGIPLGWLVDRWSRRAIAGLSVLGWSIATSLCGLAGNFSQLFLARVGVGIGEAGMSPAAFSLISDYLPPVRRARGLLALTLGASLGGGLALVFGGGLLHLLGDRGGIDLPVLGSVRNWQVVFLALGLLGVLYSLVFLTVREPVRQERLATRKLTTRDTSTYIWSRRSVLLYHFFGVGTSALVLMAMNLWVPSFLIRTLGWDRMAVGVSYGACLLSASIAGIFIAGSVTSRLLKAGRRDAALKVAFWSVIAAMPPLLAAPFMTSPFLVLPLLFVGLICVTMPAALGPVFLQGVCANEVRGQVIAVYLLIVALIGNVVGPLTVASITDYVVRDPAKIYISLFIVVLVFLPLSAFTLARAGRSYARLTAAPDASSPQNGAE